MGTEGSTLCPPKVGSRIHRTGLDRTSHEVMNGARLRRER